MFKKSIFLSFLFLSFFLFGSTVVIATWENNRPKYAPDEVLVKFKKGQVNLANPGLMSLFREYNTRTNNDLEKDEVLESGNVVVYKIKDGRSVEEVVNEVRLDSNVETVEPNYYSHISDLGTDDVDKNKLWGLDNFGQTITFDNGTTSVGTSGADIDLPRAWNISVGTSDVIVAVIDTGVAWNHPDLVDNMWDGSNCVNQSGETIVGGCLHGYNFVTNSTNPAPVLTDLDSSSHGTHVAGTIAAKVNNGLGIAGVSQKIKIMALNIQSADGHFYSSDIVKAIDFAIENGVKIINASLAGSSYSSSEYDAINRFKTAGGIFITSAGNDSSDNETVHQYPSDFDLDNIVSVAATDNNDLLASFSNYGGTSVDVGAPGVEIYSTVSFRKDYIEDYLDYTNGSGSYWQVANTNVGKIFITDSRTPYSNNSDYTITSENVDIAAMVSNPTKFVFKAQCYDVGTTDGSGDAASDYVVLEFSDNGTDFVEVSKFNKASISGLTTGSCGSTYCSNTFNIDIGSSYLTSNFKYRLRWKTDSSLNTDTGCYVYDIKIVDYPENGTGAGYDFKDGTSMAAPHVAGLAGYLLSVNPSATYSQLRDIILSNGDAIDSLSGKTTTGKRINAYNSVLEMGSVTPVPVPSAPSNLVATPGDSQVLLSWTGPTDVGSSIIQYQIGYKESLISDTEINWTTQVVDTSEINVSNIVITGLTNGTSYDFRVAAVNQTGLGAYVRSDGVTPTASIPVPSAPTNLTGTPGSNQVTLSWNSPVDIGSTILDYQIDYGIGESWNVFAHEIPITGTSTIVDGLTNGVIYNFRVSAINQTGVGATSSSITVTAGSDSKAILGFVFSEIGTSGLINGTDIGVTVPYRTDITNLTPIITVDVGASISPSSGVARDFTNPVIYTVTAENNSIQNYTVIVTIGPVPVPSAPSNLVTVPSDSQVLLSWTGPTDVGSSIIQYQVGYKLSSAEDTDWTDQVITTSEINVSNIEITSLTNGTSYDFRVAAVNQTGLGAYVRSDGITPTADFTNLDVAITTAQSWYSSAVAGTEYGQYPSTAIDDLQSAITVATGVRNNLTSNQDQINLAVSALNNAVTTFMATKIVPSSIGATDLSDLITYGTFTTTPSDENPEEISKITVTNNITINIGTSDNLSTVYLPQGIEITEYDNQFFNFNELSADVVDKNTLSDLGSGFTKEAAIQWGIPDETLTFNNPITINILVGTDLNGRTLNVLRSPNGSSGWTNEGIVSPATCVVSGGYCQFLTTKASYFVVASYEAQNQQNISNNENNPPGPKICTDTPPIDNPDLFEIKTIKGSVKLFYTPTSRTTSYAVLYGLKKGDERFGTFVNTINENKGVQNVDINMLNPKITYYFKVAAINGCTMGPWSEWVPAKANRKSTIYKYKTIIKNKLKTLINIFK
ncbi:MAG: S8 family serine peptidase [Candidatus Shapirobacteria bacterium]|nr:S8 family serine peptidase [Candidatus Shapirobacteria bacterium]